MIERVLAPNPGPMTGTGTNTYLVVQPEGTITVIDPGPDDPAHLQAILERAQALGRITAVLVTHRHVDHLPAAAPLCAQTGAPLLGHPDLPGVQQPLRDGDTAAGHLVALATPGHTRESLCYFDASQGALFTGDLVAGAGTVVLDDQPGALTDYMASLERLLAKKPRTIYPGHGPVVSDAVGKLSEYLEHRRQRVQQVFDALAQRGSATSDELASAIYTDVAPNLMPMAARNVRVALEKLEADGRAVSVGGDRWRTTR